MMSLSVFAARATLVFSIGWNCGSPEYATSGAFTVFLSMRAVCGTCASRTASAACCVPGTDASTRERGCATGIFLKSSGRLGVANVHGPLKSGAVNHRPATRKYTGPPLPKRKTSLSVLLTHSRCVPVTTRYAGAPLTRISSAGFVLVKTCGIVVTACAGIAALTSFQLSSAGSFEKLAGSFDAGFHGPASADASYQDRPSRRYSVLVGGCWNRSQFVLTANCSSLSLIGLQT